MCGISGIINIDNSPVAKTEITAMNDLIAHRGPDSEGYFEGTNFTFGHRRLSIIGLGEEGFQPMTLDKNYTITYNGEVYNYIEIRNELVELGHSFKTSTDTEVILASFKEWGESCVTKFNGMWSFAIYDHQSNQIFCSRDRFGIKPFYYMKDEKRFVFGSEIKQLLNFIDRPAVNKTILLDYLITGIEEHNQESFFKNILKLDPGHNLIYDLNNHSFQIKSYYQLKISESRKTEPEQVGIETYRKSLENAVLLRMRSDVKVGTCLSGGLDSSSVAALSSKIYRKNSSQKFTAIHAKSSEVDSDESSFASQVADHCELDLHVIEPTREDFIKYIDEIVYTQEEPFGSPSIFMQYFVMQKAKEINCKVMLDGQGGDETLLGYEKYYPAYLKSFKGVSFLKEFFNSSKNSKLSKLDVLKYFLYFTKYSIRLNRLKKKNDFLKDKVKQSYESETLQALSNHYLNIVDLQKFEISHTQLPHLLRYEDRNSMRNSIETRLPFIDYTTLETALSTRNDLKIKQGWTKYLLRKSIEDYLPHSVVWRKNKFGFNAPERSWLELLEKDMPTLLEGSNILNHFIDKNKLNLDTMSLRTKWRLINIAKWEKIYNVSID